MPIPHREFKDRLYGQFARIGKALASPHRLEMLELLAQGERTVDSLGDRSRAVAGQHVAASAGAATGRRWSRAARRVCSSTTGLAGRRVFELSKVVRTVAERRLAELERLVREHFGDRSDTEPVRHAGAARSERGRGKVVVLDTRPASEYAAGHIAGAISVPVDELKRRLAELPKDKEYVAYCRGPYCVYADRAVELLQCERTARAAAARRISGVARRPGLPVSER